MVSLFGRGFDSLQLHKIRSSAGRPYFVELKGVGDLFLFCFAKALHSIPLSGPPGPRSPRPGAFCGAGGVGYLFLFRFAKKAPSSRWGSRVPFFILLRKSAPFGRLAALRVRGLAPSIRFAPIRLNLRGRVGGAQRGRFYLCPFVPLLCPKYIVYLWL